MKKVVAIIMVLISFGTMYDIVLILNGTYLPPYSISLIGEVSTRAYLMYKITSVIAMLFVAFKIFNPEIDEKGHLAKLDR
tara:strand:+ start:37894 stop:38133 length:240 start_codon:yes stop_codon:yes gene_type:complete